MSDIVRSNRRAVARAQTGAVVHAAEVEAAEFVTYTALLGAARLSHVEETCQQLAPGGARRYAAIADAYTMTAANIIVGMGR